MSMKFNSLALSLKQTFVLAKNLTQLVLRHGGGNLHYYSMSVDLLNAGKSCDTILVIAQRSFTVYCSVDIPAIQSRGIPGDGDVTVHMELKIPQVHPHAGNPRLEPRLPEDSQILATEIGYMPPELAALQRLSVNQILKDLESI